MGNANVTQISSLPSFSNQFVTGDTSFKKQNKKNFVHSIFTLHKKKNYKKQRDSKNRKISININEDLLKQIIRNALSSDKDDKNNLKTTSINQQNPQKQIVFKNVNSNKQIQEIKNLKIDEQEEEEEEQQPDFQQNQQADSNLEQMQKSKQVNQSSVEKVTSLDQTSKEQKKLIINPNAQRISLAVNPIRGPKLKLSIFCPDGDKKLKEINNNITKNIETKANSEEQLKQQQQKQDQQQQQQESQQQQKATEINRKIRKSLTRQIDNETQKILEKKQNALRKFFFDDDDDFNINTKERQSIKQRFFLRNSHAKQTRHSSSSAIIKAKYIKAMDNNKTQDSDKSLEKQDSIKTRSLSAYLKRFQKTFISLSPFKKLKTIKKQQSVKKIKKEEKKTKKLSAKIKYKFGNYDPNKQKAIIKKKELEIMQNIANKMYYIPDYTTSSDQIAS